MPTDDILLQQFAARMNELCDDMGVPPKGSARQTTVANLFDVSQKGARKWLEGEGFPTLDKADRICAWGHCSFDWLMTGRGKKNPNLQSASGGGKKSASSDLEANPSPPDERTEAVVIEWNEISDLERILLNPAGHERLHKAYSIAGRGFVLRVRDDSMAPQLPIGALVLIDPDEAVAHNRIVLVAEAGAEPMLRRLMLQGSQRLLKADNDRYGPLTPMPSEQQIVGVAVDAVVRLL